MKYIHFVLFNKFGRTIHLVILQDFQNLPKLIERQQEMARLSNTTSNRHYFGHDLWLIFSFGESKNSLEYITNALKPSLIRFDSGLFGFIQNTKGEIV